MIQDGGTDHNQESMKKEILLRMEEQGIFQGFPSEYHDTELLFQLEA